MPSLVRMSCWAGLIVLIEPTFAFQARHAGSIPSSARMKKAQVGCAFRTLGLRRLVTVEAFGHAWACAFASSIQVWHSCSDRATTAPCRVSIISLR
jgi:hypothetical protein